MKEVKNIYLFLGNDTYTSLEKLKSWLAVFKNKYPYGSITNIHADELNEVDLMKKVESSLSSGSLFDETSLVLIKRFWQKNISDLVRLKILEIIKRAKDKTFLIVWQDGEIKSSDLVFKALEKSANVKIERFSKPQNRIEFNLWLKNRLKTKNIQLENQTFENLAVAFGRDLIRKERGEVLIPFEIGEIEQTLNNLEVVKENPNLSQLVDQLVTPKVNPVIFAFTDSLTKRDFKTSLVQLDKLLVNDSPEMIFSTILWQYRTILKIRAGLKEGLLEGEIAKKMQLAPFVVQKNLTNAQRLSLEDLREIYERFMDFEYSTKTGFDSVWKLEELVINLCR